MGEGLLGPAVGGIERVLNGGGPRRMIGIAPVGGDGSEGLDARM